MDLATTIFLIMFTVNSRTSYPVIVYQHAMPDFATCQEAVHNAKVDVSHGADNEAMAVIYCGYGPADPGELRRQRNKS